MLAKRLIILLCSILTGCHPSANKAVDKNDVRSHLNELYSKRFSLLFWYVNNVGEEQAATAKGKAVYNKQDNTISVYKDGTEKPIAVLNEEDFDRIKPVQESLKKIMLDAEYAMELNVGDVPSDADTTRYLPLGFEVPVN